MRNAHSVLNDDFQPLSRGRGVTVMALALTLTFTLTLMGCSRESATPTASTPLPLRPAAVATPDSPPRHSIAAKIMTGGVASSYEARFADGKIERITETHGPGSTGSQPASAQYVFYGARLTQYRGMAPGSMMQVELNFDMQGNLTAAAGQPSVPVEDLTAIKARGQLLRSHALAQRSVGDHKH